MFRIDSEGATSDHRFTEGNVLQGILPTKLSHEWLNSVQEEIANTIESSGLTLDQREKTNHTQLFEAISQMIQKGISPVRFDLPHGEVIEPRILSGLSFDPDQIRGGYLKATYCLTHEENKSIGNLEASFIFSRQWGWKLHRILNPNVQGPPEIELGITEHGDLTFIKPFCLWPGKLIFTSIKTMRSPLAPI